MRAHRLLWIAAISAACASSNESAPVPDAPAGEIVFTIDNSRGDLGALNIILVPDVGSRELLGLVERSQSARFNFIGKSGMYHLVAQRQAGGSDLETSRFRAAPGQIVAWNLALNNVVVRNR